MLRHLVALLGCVVLAACGRNSRAEEDAFFGITTTDTPTQTFLTYAECQPVCDLPCTRTIVNYPDEKKLMHTCFRLKVIKTSFMDNLKGGTFQNAIIVVVVVTIAGMLSIVCVYYCCCSRRDDDKYHHGRDEFRELGPGDERKALNKGSSVIEV